MSQYPYAHIVRWTFESRLIEMPRHDRVLLSRARIGRLCRIGPNLEIFSLHGSSKILNGCTRTVGVQLDDVSAQVPSIKAFLSMVWEHRLDIAMPPREWMAWLQLLCLGEPGIDCVVVDRLLRDVVRTKRLEHEPKPTKLYRLSIVIQALMAPISNGYKSEVVALQPHKNQFSAAVTSVTANRPRTGLRNSEESDSDGGDSVGSVIDDDDTVWCCEQASFGPAPTGWL